MCLSLTHIPNRHSFLETMNHIAALNNRGMGKASQKLFTKMDELCLNLNDELEQHMRNSCIAFK